MRTAILSTLALLTSPVAMAQPHFVGPTCTHQTIASAVAAAGANDVIWVAIGTYNENIGSVTVPGLIIQPGASGCTAATTPGFVFITGPGGGRVVSVQLGADLTLNNLWLFGNGQAGNGGLIEVVGGTLNLNTVVVNGGDTTSGGGIHASNGSINIRANSRLYGNTATGSGGAIFAVDSDVTIDDSAIGGDAYAPNEASHGGGIYLRDSTFAITDSDIGNNHATGLGANGGGLRIDGSTGTIEGGKVGSDSALGGNTAAFGGGGLDITNDGVVEITNTLFLNNSASNGGAISSTPTPVIGGAARAGTVTFIGGELGYNTATNDGGGAYLDDEPSAMDFSGTRFHHNVAQTGGGIMAHGGSLVVVEATIEDNTARVGGGVWLNHDAEGSIEDSVVESNHATGVLDGNGGGLGLEDAVVNVVDSVFSSNSAAVGGGGLFVGDVEAVLDCYLCAVQSNTARYGGGVNIEDGDALFTLATVKNNVAESGGGFWVAGQSTTDIANGLLVSNEATGGDGGGAGVADDARFRMNQNECAPTVFDQYCSELRGNVSANDGGGLWVGPNAKATIKETALIQNTSMNEGSAVASSGDLFMRTTYVRDNDSQLLTTGAISVDAGSTAFRLHSSTVMWNLDFAGVSDDFGGIYRNNIIWGNGRGVHAGFLGAATSVCNTVDNVGGTGTVSHDPTDPLLVVDPMRGPDRPDLISTMVDRCDTGYAKDLDNEGRPAVIFNAATPWDRGAFELQ